MYTITDITHVRSKKGQNTTIDQMPLIILSCSICVLNKLNESTYYYNQCLTTKILKNKLT